LAKRCIESIRNYCERPLYQLAAGANAVGARTEAYLAKLHAAGDIDRLHLSQTNLNKCPMMRRMFDDIDTEFIWWFDDDSYITKPGALLWLLGLARKSPPTTVMWGQEAECNHTATFINLPDAAGFIRSASWYGGLTPPSWQPGGKGEFNFEGKGTGDGRWRFIVGGCWLIRTRAVRTLDWPDRRLIKLGDDVLLGEAVRQQGWEICNTGMERFVINAARRRGDPGKL
jgi:GT2 family glycosyltransferase